MGILSRSFKRVELSTGICKLYFIEIEYFGKDPIVLGFRIQQQNPKV